MRTVTAVQQADLAEVTAGWNIINVTVGPGGEMLVLLLKQQPDYRATGLGASYAKPFADRPNQFRICRLQEGMKHTIDLPETRENFHFLQPLDAGRWLLVRARTVDQSDLNAHIYSAAGQHLSAFHTGNSVQDVQATKDGDIWVSFFDQGVCSNDEMAQEGVLCLDDCGKISFTLASLPNVPYIADCYAMNVAYKNEVWLCYYTDFPLVRIRDKKLSHIWPDMPVAGSRAFAVTKDRVLFAGGYQERPFLFLVSLFPVKAQQLQPVNNDSEVLTAFSAFGRGSKLYLIEGTCVYMIDANDVWQEEYP